MKKLLKSVTVLCLGIVISLLSAISGCSIIVKNDIKRVLKAYTSEDSLNRYYTFKAVVVEGIDSASDVEGIDSASSEELCRFFKFEVDYDYFEQHYSDDPYATADGTKRWEGALEYFNRFYFEFIDSNLLIINENGGYDKLVEGAEVIISANNYFGWNGWTYPILSLQIGDTVYLDFETGLENYLNYVHAGFKDPE